jgi:nitronate monooxygenase
MPIGLACEIGFLAEAIPDFPLPLGEPEPLRAAAEQKGCRDLTPLWSGQAAALSREMPAAILMQITVKETLERLHRLRCN